MGDFANIVWVRQKLIEAGHADQDVRKTREFEAWRNVDADNQSLLKQIIAQHGWPGISLVGVEAERAAFLIAQHATNDVPLMEKVLSLRNQLPEGEAHRAHTALLEDRLLMFKEQPQRYGTQIINGKIYPIRGIDVVKLCAGDRLQMEILTARRKTAGLEEPYDDYLKHFGIGVRELNGRGLV